MNSKEEIFDTIVVGGGIAGLGVAAELLKQNRSVLLLEKSNLSEATSASSLRIIHGGFRYLQNFDLLRLIESLRDQHSLLNDYPSQFKTLPCLLPVQQSGLKSRWPMACGALLYNLFSRTLTGHSNGAAVILASDLGERRPSFFDGSERLLNWNDVVLCDPREFARDLKNMLVLNGAVVFENSVVTKIASNGQRFSIDVIRAGSSESYSSKSVVNTTGPWLHLIATDSKVQTSCPFGWCKAFNIILKRQYEPYYGVGVWGPQKRSFFLVPRDARSVLGTWYQPYNASPDEVSVGKEDLSQFIECFNKSAFSLKFSMKDIEDYEVGVLPMRKVGVNGPVMYGIEKIFSKKGYVQVLSTKYTTFRSQARKVCKRLG